MYAAKHIKNIFDCNVLKKMSLNKENEFSLQNLKNIESI